MPPRGGHRKFVPVVRFSRRCVILHIYRALLREFSRVVWRRLDEPVQIARFGASMLVLRTGWQGPLKHFRQILSRSVRYTLRQFRVMEDDMTNAVALTQAAASCRHRQSQKKEEKRRIFEICSVTGTTRRRKGGSRRLTRRARAIPGCGMRVAFVGLRAPCPSSLHRF